MVLGESPVDVILLPFFGVEIYFAGI